MVSNSPLSDIPVSREEVKRDIPAAITTRQLSQPNGFGANAIIEEERSINADQIEIEPKTYQRSVRRSKKRPLFNQKLADL